MALVGKGSHLLPRLASRVQSLEPTWREEKTHACTLSSAFHRRNWGAGLEKGLLPKHVD